MPFAGRTAGRGDHRNGKLLQQGDAKQEITDPQRVLTILMRPEGADRPLSVKTDRPVPKALLKECAKAVYSTHPKLPVKYGDVLIENLCGTGAKVIATADMKA